MLEFSLNRPTTRDDSTDVGACEQSMWFVRSAKEGKINIRFLGNKTLERADAESIINGVKELVDVNLQMKWQAFMDRVVASTTDGARVMLGRVGGVCVRLQAYQPSMIIVHCMAHRLELAWGDACKKLPIYDKSIETLAVGLFYFLLFPLRQALHVKFIFLFFICQGPNYPH